MPDSLCDQLHFNRFAFLTSFDVRHPVFVGRDHALEKQDAGLPCSLLPTTIAAGILNHKRLSSNTAPASPGRTHFHDGDLTDSFYESRVVAQKNPIQERHIVILKGDKVFTSRLPRFLWDSFRNEEIPSLQEPEIIRTGVDVKNFHEEMPDLGGLVPIPLFYLLIYEGFLDHCAVNRWINHLKETDFATALSFLQSNPTKFGKVIWETNGIHPFSEISYFEPYLNDYIKALRERTGIDVEISKILINLHSRTMRYSRSYLSENEVTCDLYEAERILLGKFVHEF